MSAQCWRQQFQARRRTMIRHIHASALLDTFKLPIDHVHIREVQAEGQDYHEASKKGPMDHPPHAQMIVRLIESPLDNATVPKRLHNHAKSLCYWILEVSENDMEFVLDQMRVFRLPETYPPKHIRLRLAFDIEAATPNKQRMCMRSCVRNLLRAQGAVEQLRVQPAGALEEELQAMGDCISKRK